MPKKHRRSRRRKRGTHQNKPDMDQDKDDNKTKGSPAPASDSDKVGSSDTGPPRSNETQPSKKLITSRGLEIFFAGTVALFTVVLAVVSCEQWKVMELQGNAMIQANVLLGQSNEHANRAWLTIKAVRDAPPIFIGSHASLTADIENTGRSPAQNVRVNGMTAYALLDWVIPGHIPETAESIGVIGPGQIRSVDFKRNDPLSKLDVEAINNGTRRIYWIADVTYADQFGSDRLLQFCFFYVPPDKNKSVVSYPVCPSHESVK